MCGAAGHASTITWRGTWRCRVTERQRNHERADDRQELGDQVDRRQHPQSDQRQRDPCSSGTRGRAGVFGLSWHRPGAR